MAAPAPTSTATPPSGFDVAVAKSLAPGVNANLIAKGRDRYDRAALKKFQVAAGIAADGLYGGGSRGALIFYGIAKPPNPFFKPTTTAPYPWTAFIAAQLGVPVKGAPAPTPPAPPSPGWNPLTGQAATDPSETSLIAAKPLAGFAPVSALALAPSVAKDLQTAGRNKYNRALLKRFQGYAGIPADGIYGGGSRGALIFYGISNPPAPFFKPTTTATYPWIINAMAILKESQNQPITPIPPKPVTPAPVTPVTPIPSVDEQEEDEEDDRLNPDPIRPPTPRDDIIPAGPSDPSGPSGGGGLSPTQDSEVSGADAGAAATGSNVVGPLLAMITVGILGYAGYRVLRKNRRGGYVYA